MPKLLSLIIILQIIFFQNSYSETSYYVSLDGNNQSLGTLSEPFRTINRAIWFAQPGDKIIVRGGIYREEVKFIRDGEPAAPITLTNYADETVIISGAELVTHWQRFQEHIFVSQLDFPTLQVWQDTLRFLQSVSRIELMTPGSFFFDHQQLRLYVWCISGDSPENHVIEAGKRREGINLSLDEQGTGCSHIALRANLTGKMIIQHIMGTEYEAFGIYLGYGSDYNIVSGASSENRNFIIRCIGRWWCDQQNWYMGIQLRRNSGNDGARFNIIQFTDISWCGDKGIQLWGENTSDNIIRYNDIHDNGVHGIVPNRGADANIIEWNRVWGHDGAPDKMNDGGAGIKVDEARDNIIRFNLCWQNGFGIGIIDDCENTQVYHNIAYHNRGFAQVLGYGLICKGTNPGHTDIRNNVFFENYIAQIYYDQAAVANASHQIEANLIYSQVTQPDWDLIRWGSQGYLNVEQWQTVSGLGNKCLHQNPEFVSPAALNFHLLPTSPLIDAGIELGLPFNEQAPDIGLFETQKVLVNATINAQPELISQTGEVEFRVDFSENIINYPVLKILNNNQVIDTLILNGTLPGRLFSGTIPINTSFLDGSYDVVLDESTILLDNYNHALLNCDSTHIEINIPPPPPQMVRLAPPNLFK